MRFHLGAIPTNSAFQTDESWHPLREPSIWRAQLHSAPFAMLNFVFLCLPCFLLTPVTQDAVRACALKPLALLLLVPLIAAHECIHALTHPNHGLSSDTVIGAWPSHMLFYTHYDADISKKRFIAICLMPLLGLSCVPLLICAALRIDSPLVAWLPYGTHSCLVSTSSELQWSGIRFRVGRGLETKAGEHSGGPRRTPQPSHGARGSSTFKPCRALRGFYCPAVCQVEKSGPLRHSNKEKVMFSRHLFLTIVALVVVISSMAGLPSPGGPPSITVVGEAKQTVSPDTMEITVQDRNALSRPFRRHQGS